VTDGYSCDHTDSWTDYTSTVYGFSDNMYVSQCVTDGYSCDHTDSWTDCTSTVCGL